MNFKESTVRIVVFKILKEQLLLVGIAVIGIAFYFYYNQLISNGKHKVWSVLKTDNLILVQSPYHLMKLPVCKWGIMLGREEF